MSDWFDNISSDIITQNDQCVNTELQAECEENHYNFGLYLASPTTPDIKGEFPQKRGVFDIKNEFMNFYKKFHRLISDSTFDDTMYATSHIYDSWNGIFHDNVHMKYLANSKYASFYNGEAICAFVVRFNFSKDFRELMAIIQLMNTFFPYDKKTIDRFIFENKTFNVSNTIQVLEANWTDIHEKDLKTLSHDDEYLSKFVMHISQNNFTPDEMSLDELKQKFSNYLLFWHRIKEQKENERVIASFSKDWLEDFRIKNI